MPSLKELREKGRLTQQELADRAGVTHATISRLETGKRKPLLRTISKLAKALEVRASEIDF